jgi:hypothetical protein
MCVQINQFCLTARQYKKSHKNFLFVGHTNKSTSSPVFCRSSNQAILMYRWSLRPLHQAGRRCEKEGTQRCRDETVGGQSGLSEKRCGNVVSASGFEIKKNKIVKLVELSGFSFLDNDVPVFR